MQIVKDDDVERLKKELIQVRKLLNRALSNREMVVGRAPVVQADIIIMGILCYIGGNKEDDD